MQAGQQQIALTQIFDAQAARRRIKMATVLKVGQQEIIVLCTKSGRVGIAWPSNWFVP
jgi:hypothetical protein